MLDDAEWSISDRPTLSIKAKNARGEMFTRKAGIVRSRLGRAAAEPHHLEQVRQLLAQSKSIVNTAKACAFGVSTPNGRRAAKR
jgi:DNA invertase Pin-like site-specific DNA recombinase